MNTPVKTPKIADHSAWAERQRAHWEAQFDQRLRDFMFESKDNFSAEALAAMAGQVVR